MCMLIVEPNIPGYFLPLDGSFFLEVDGEFFMSFLRSIHLAYVKDVDVKGIQAYRFAPPRDVLMTPKENPTNAGFCVPAGDCLGTGVLKVSVCREGWCTALLPPPLCPRVNCHRAWPSYPPPTPLWSEQTNPMSQSTTMTHRLESDIPTVWACQIFTQYMDQLLTVLTVCEGDLSILWRSSSGVWLPR